MPGDASVLLTLGRWVGGTMEGAQRPQGASASKRLLSYSCRLKGEALTTVCLPLRDLWHSLVCVSFCPAGPHGLDSRSKLCSLLYARNRAQGLAQSEGFAGVCSVSKSKTE